MLTPWDQVCGNAEYAKRLVMGLATIATVTPHEMRNIGDGYDDKGRLLTRRDIDRGMRSLVARVRDSRPDIVHIQHEFSFFGRSFREADRRFLRVVSGVRRPVIVTLHTFTQKQVPVKPTRRRHKIARALLFWRKVGDLRRALRRADAIVLHSIHTQRLLVRAFPELRRKIHVVPIAIEPLPRGASGAWQKPAGERWVVLPGFVSAYKGHEHALAAIKRLPPNCKLVVAGGLHPKDPGSTETWMRMLSQADELQVRDQIIFTGFLADQGDQAEIFGQADAFLLPYNEVGQSGSAALADVMAYGRPVITSRAQSMFVYRMDRDTVNCSVAVDVTDSERLASCILECIDGNGSHDAGHLAKAISRHSLHNTTRAYERIYRLVLGGSAES